MLGRKLDILTEALAFSAGATKWGRMADTRGRLPVLYCNLIMASIFTVAFGLCNNYFVALAVRFLLGLFCDIGSITKVCVSELAGEDHVLEAKSMNFVVLSWAMAGILSPAIGGILADPVKQFPNLEILQQYTEVQEFLTMYPYFLPIWWAPLSVCWVCWWSSSIYVKP